MERRPPEGVDVDVGGGLGEGDLAGAGRAVNGSGTSPVRAAIQARTCGRQAPPWHGPEAGQARALEQLELR